jgi:hypothetical protein
MTHPIPGWLRVRDLLLNDKLFAKSRAKYFFSGLLSALLLLDELRQPYGRVGTHDICRLAAALHHPWRQKEGPEGLHVYGSIAGRFLELSQHDAISATA